jgi:hypothetical protein
MKSLPVPGVQKPPCRVGKRFQDCLGVEPKRKVKKPAGLNRDLLGCDRTAWAATRQSATATRAARLGVRSRAGLEAADGDDLVPGPDLDREGAWSVAQNSIERLEWWSDTATTDPDEGGEEELSWQLTGQLDARILLRQGKGGNIKIF